MDLYLRAGNAGALAVACPFLRHEGDWVSSGDGFVVDVIGPLELEPPRYTKFGVQTHAAVVDTGFHVNLRCSEAVAELVPDTVRVYPLTPRRAWA